MHTLIPKPTSILTATGRFTVSPSTKILSHEKEVDAIAKLLSTHFEQTSGQEIAIVNSNVEQGVGHIHLILNKDPSLGEEGYELSITPESILISANYPAGLFYATQSLLQLFPPYQSGSVILPALSIRDTPRFAWRGVMLDVARHFFSVEDVKRYIDLIVQYKLNRLHLHLTDDQGWRIEIKSWPKLTEIGGRTQVGGNGGGFYTQEQYKAIVDFA